ncbi:MAG: hypothetical protein H7A38_05240 [Chlamydiales bacterium]|nr:hypothetical protein [Chlamydiales bacterium]
MIKYFTLAALIALLIGCTSIRTSHVHTKLQTYEIDETIKDGITTKEEIAKRFGNRCTVETDVDGRERWVYLLTVSIPTFAKTSKEKISFGGIHSNSYQNPRYTNQTHFANKYEGFSPEYETKNYTLTIFIDEKGTAISHHLVPSGSGKVPAWESFHKELSPSYFKN